MRMRFCYSSGVGFLELSGKSKQRQVGLDRSITRKMEGTAVKLQVDLTISQRRLNQTLVDRRAVNVSVCRLTD